jgi:carboxypeptidase C (cathepsin A)
MAALTKGDRISKEERDAVVRQLARFTGLDPAFIRTTNLGIGTDQFAKNLLRDQDRELSWFNANTTAEVGPTGAPYDLWSNNLIREPTSTLITPYLSDELGFKTNAAYLGIPGGGPPTPVKWDWAVYKNGDAGRDLAEAMRRNAALRLFVAQGYYDLLTPYLAASEAVRRLELDATRRRDVQFGNYKGGHLMYIEKPVLVQMTGDIGEFIRKTASARRPISAPR